VCPVCFFYAILAVISAGFIAIISSLTNNQTKEYLMLYIAVAIIFFILGTVLGVKKADGIKEFNKKFKLFIKHKQQ